MSKKILGIDVSKKELSTSLLKEGKYKYKSFENNISGFANIDSWLKEQKAEAAIICLEATGSYGEELVDALYVKGYEVKVVNPLKIKSFARTKLARHKTDKIDAGIIAEYGSKFDDISYKPIAENLKKLRGLYRCSQELINQITYCHNQLERRCLLVSEVVKTWEHMLEEYEKRLEEIEKAMRQLIDTDGDLKKRYGNLVTIKGIGSKTAIAVIAEVANFASFENARQLAAYSGLTPKHYSSGSSVYSRPKISKMGSSTLRKALFFPAISAMRHNLYFKEFAEKLTKRGKKKKQIICAVMRKLLHIIFGVLKNNEVFNEKKLIPNVWRDASGASAQSH